MRRAFLLAAAALGLAFIAAPASAQSAAPGAQSFQSVVDELLAADRSYSAASAKVDLAEGIGAMLDGDAIMPIPAGFARGKDAVVAALKGNPANAGARATWTPVRGGISADGAHGFTLGFMTITADGKPDRKAKYLSYWVKKPEGWRVAVYKRNGRPDGEVSLDLMPASLPDSALKPAADSGTLETYRASLDKAERAFSDLAQKIGLGPAFVQNGRSDATNSGSGPGFTVGNEKIGADVGSGGGPGVTWAPDGGVIVAATGDLGITWGLIRPNAAPKPGEPTAFPYTTIWRRAGPDQPWRYVAE
jgi:ketosteroid isomerase-like protein